jgi:hypothetical protein
MAYCGILLNFLPGLNRPSTAAATSSCGTFYDNIIISGNLGDQSCVLYGGSPSNTQGQILLGGSP